MNGGVKLIEQFAKAGLLAACAGFGLMLVACAPRPTYEYQYRLTMDVEVDGRVHSGSSVTKVIEARTPKTSLQPHLHVTDRQGEATFVDLGNGRVLVALLDGESQGQGWGAGPTPLLLKKLGLRSKWDDQVNPAFATLVASRGEFELEREELPALVILEDARDPLTIKAVTVADLERRGIVIRRVALAVVSDPPSHSIERTFPWLTELHGRYIGGHTSSTSTGFHGGQFMR